MTDPFLMDVDGNVYSFFFRVIKLRGCIVPVGGTGIFSAESRRKLQYASLSRHPPCRPRHRAPRRADEARERFRMRRIVGPRGAAEAAVITAVSSRIHQLSMTRRHESAAPGQPPRWETSPPPPSSPSRTISSASGLSQIRAMFDISIWW